MIVCSVFHSGGLAPRLSCLAGCDVCLLVPTQMNNTFLDLDSSPQTRHGVELSKSKAGVTAKVSLSNFQATVFFDGTTAQIYMKGKCNRK